MLRAHEARRRVTATSTTLLGTIATALTDHNPWPRKSPNAWGLYDLSGERLGMVQRLVC